MKHRRLLPLLLVLVLSVSLFVSAEVSAAIQLTDMAGRAVSLAAPAAHIVALQPADCEILYAIGAKDAMVGRGEYCNYPAEVLDLPSVQSGYETNIEQIIALDPDAVIMSVMSQQQDHIKKLEDAGIPVIVTDAQTIEGVYIAIELLGQVTGKAENAAQLVLEMKNAFEKVSQRVKDAQEATIYFEASPLEYGLWTAGKGTFMHEIAEIVGLTNLFEDIEGWQAISEEQVLSRDPDYIVTTTMYFGEGPTPVEEIIGRANWGDIKAVKLNQVFNADADAITRPGPRLVEATEALYAFIYGR